MAVIMYFKELFWITNGICKTVWKKPYRQYDVLIAKVLSIDICKKKIIYVTIICLPFLQIIVSYSLYNQRLPMSERGAMIWLLNS